MSGDPRVDLERVDLIVDAVDTATSTLSVFFKCVEMQVLTCFVGVDLLRAPHFALVADVARLGGI